MPNLTLNAQPYPQTGESMRGYFLRLADTNGYKSVIDMLNRLDCRYNLRITPIQHRDTDCLLAKLSNVLRLEPPDTLRDRFSHPWGRLISNEDSKLSTRLYLRHGRVCPLCLSEKHFVPAEWDWSSTVVCTRHRVELIDTCPHCGDRIALNRGRLNRCSRCRKPLSDAPLRPVEPSNPLFDLQSKIEQGEPEHTRALLHATDFVHQPLRERTSSVPLSTMSAGDAMSVLTTAAHLLSSAQYREGFQRWVSRSRSGYSLISKQIPDKPFANFLVKCGGSIYNAGPGKAFSHEESELQHAICDRNMDIAIENLPRYLGTTQQEASQLISETCQSTLEIGRKKTSVADLGGLMTLTSQLTAATNEPTDRLHLLEISRGPLLKRFGVAFITVLSAGLYKEFPLYRDEGDSLMESYTTEYELLRYLHRTLVSAKQTYSLFQLANILTTDTNTLRQMHREGAIGLQEEPQPTASFGHLTVNRDSIDVYINDLISLNRIAYFCGFRLKALRQILEKNGFTPDLVITATKTPLVLFKLSPAERNELLDFIHTLKAKPSMYDGYRFNNAR